MSRSSSLKSLLASAGEEAGRTDRSDKVSAVQGVDVDVVADGLDAIGAGGEQAGLESNSRVERRGTTESVEVTIYPGG